MKQSALALACVLAVTPGLANATQTACLTQAEFSSLAGYALPSVISGTSKRCEASLADDAFLRASGSQLVERYASRKEAAWPGAKAAFIKLSESREDETVAIFRKMPDSTLQEVVDIMLEGMIGQEIPLEKCDTIDSFLRLLAPLPPENTADLIGLTVGLVSKGKEGKVGKLAICEN